MAFEKGNKLGKLSKRGKAKKTVIKESFEALKKVGLNPLEVSREMIDSLINNTSLSNKEQIALLQVVTSLFKYQLLTRAEELKLQELQEDIQEIKETKREVLTTSEILKKLKEDD